ncbi:protein YbgS [Sodalis sp.]|uniref:protein YbgS n=1 Tax=Sodalis sp. (in: enterobacteria) TaxID=1898979 RepID=UPI0038735346
MCKDGRCPDVNKKVETSTTGTGSPDGIKLMVQRSKPRRNCQLASLPAFRSGRSNQALA